MAITVTDITQGNLRLSYRPAGASAPNPEAWKSLIGKKPVSARLDTLPETKPRLSALLTSTIFQAAVAAFLVAIPMFFPDKLVTKIAYEVVPIAAPQTEVQLAAQAAGGSRQGSPNASSSGRGTTSASARRQVDCPAATRPAEAQARGRSGRQATGGATRQSSSYGSEIRSAPGAGSPARTGEDRQSHDGQRRTGDGQ